MWLGNKVHLRGGGSSGHDGVKAVVEGWEMPRVTYDFLFFLAFHQPDKTISS